MKTVLKILLVAVIISSVYFATIGKDDFYSLLYMLEEVIQVVAENYLKK